MTVCFCGHRDMYANADALRVWLENSLKALIERGADRFYLGGYGAFDSMAAVTLRDMRAIHPCIESVLVLAYLGRPLDELDRQLYDRTTYPPLEGVPKRYAILRRNEWVVDHSDAVVSAVLHEWGGAYQMLAYAKRKSREIISFSEVAL